MTLSLIRKPEEIFKLFDITEDNIIRSVLKIKDFKD